MRAPHQPPRVVGLLARLSVLALTLSGCGKSSAPIAPSSSHVPESALRAEIAEAGGIPGASDASLFYPLQTGNHWSYEHSLTLYFVPEGGPPGPAFGVSDQRDRDLVCIEQRAGRDYAVEQHSLSGTPPWWVRYRQDDGGLHEFDGDFPVPPECAGTPGRRAFEAEGVAAGNGEAAWTAIAASLGDPAEQIAYRAAWDRVQTRASAILRALGVEAGVQRAASSGAVESGEITRLQYPLHPGAHWVIRADPRFDSTVEGADALDLAVGRLTAWRIRIDSELFGTRDQVHVWYGRDGYLKLVVHLEGTATDEQGNIIGRMIADETETLTELSLGGGRFAAP